MLWLDSTYPTNEAGPGTGRGTCSTDSGVPSDVESSAGSSSVVYSNIKFGPIRSTFDSSSVSDSNSGSSSSAAASSSASQAVAEPSTAPAAVQTDGSVTQDSAPAAMTSPDAVETTLSSGAASSVEAQAQAQVQSATSASSASAATEPAMKPKSCKRRNKVAQN